MEDASASKNFAQRAEEASNGQADQPRKKRNSAPRIRAAKSTQAPQEPQGDTQEKMLLRAAFGDQVAEAEVALEAFCERAVRSDRRLSTGLDEEMPKVYAGIVHLQEAGRVDEFLAHKKVKTHGNVRNPLSPIVRALATKNGEPARSWLSKIAAMLALARHHEITPSEFLQWRSKWPLEKAASKWRGLQRSSSKSAQSEEQAGKRSTGLLASLQAAWDAVSADEKELFLTRNGLTMGGG